MEAWVVRYPFSSADSNFDASPATIVGDNDSSSSSSSSNNNSGNNRHDGTGNTGGVGVGTVKPPPQVLALTTSASLKPVGIPPGLTTFSSASPNLDAVFALCQYTAVGTSLDVSTDSNTRQRSTCHIDMRVATLGMLYSVDGDASAMPTHNAALMLQANSNILDGWADFKAATVFTVHAAILHGGPLDVARANYKRLVLFSLLNFYNASVGLLVKPSKNVNGLNSCLNGTSPCAGDLIDWPRNNRDGYMLANNTISAVPNGYAAQALRLMADIAAWLGFGADAKRFRSVSDSIKASMRAKLYNAPGGHFVDGLGVNHAAVHASTVAAATGVIVNATMADAVLEWLQARGLFTGEVLTTCWMAGATLEALYQLDRVSVRGAAADVALKYMSRTGHRSWMAMMTQYNATMTMEAWSPDDNTGGA